METRSAFIAIIGCPNVGKSTLVNLLVGEKVAIVSPKPQTTRNRISGILTDKDYQMVFLDTPGIHEAKDKLGEYMVKIAYDTLQGVDAVLFMCDAKFGIGERDLKLIGELKKTGTPLIAAVNKKDAAGEERTAVAVNTVKDAGVGEIYAISAKTGEGTAELLDALKTHLVPGPFYYPEDYYTDQPERVIAAEMIREKALKLLHEEVPHGIGVTVERVSQREDRELMDVSAVIVCEKDSHKAIIIGHGGQMLRRIGTEARAELEMLFGMKVFLELFVKVEPLWRDSKRVMRDLGYE